MDNRLKKQSDFDLVFKKGKRCYGKSLMMIYVKAKTYKVGFSVSKKNGGAVVRNRVKRLLRASLRNFGEKIKKDEYLVFVPKRADEYSYVAFRDDMRIVLEKENLLND